MGALMAERHFSWVRKLLRQWRGRGPDRRMFPQLRPNFDQLEDRNLFSLNVWLPQRLQPLDGIAGYNQPFQLFQPIAATLRPNLGLNSGAVSFSGQFTFTDSGGYSLTLYEAGPFDSTHCFVFTAAGGVTFNLQELGTF